MNNNMYRHQQPYPLSGYYPPELNPPSMVPMSYTHWHPPIPTYHPTWQPTPMYPPTATYQPIQYHQPTTPHPIQPTVPTTINIPLHNPLGLHISVFRKHFYQSPIFKFTPVAIWQSHTGMILATMMTTHAAILVHTIEDILSQIQSSTQLTPHPTKPTPTPKSKPQPKLPTPQPSPATPLTSLPLLHSPPGPNFVLCKPYRVKRWLKSLMARGKQPTYICVSEWQYPHRKLTNSATTHPNIQHQSTAPLLSTHPPKAITLIEVLQDLWKQPTVTHKVQPPSLEIQSSAHQSRSHIPYQSRPRSQLTYGLCWHLALLVKAMATAWDLITQTDLWSNQL